MFCIIVVLPIGWYHFIDQSDTLTHSTDVNLDKPQLAWDVYINTEVAEAFLILKQIANDCYRRGMFLFAARAFDALQRLDPNPEYWEGKRGACVVCIVIN